MLEMSASSSAPSLQTFIREHIAISSSGGASCDWAWDHYIDTVRNLVRHFSTRSVIEIGGGRSPLFTREQLDALGVAFAINDISRRELDRAPSWLHKSCFDIAGPSVPASEEGSYDLAVSKMVMEHVQDGEQTYRNIYRMLKPGGLFFNFHPVLYSPPFVINKLLPDALSRPMVNALFRNRNDNQIPKFPAHYSFCVISERTEEMLARVGFREVALVPIYGHRYFRAIPLLRHLDRALSNAALSRGWRRLASFCYALGRK